MVLAAACEGALELKLRGANGGKTLAADVVRPQATPTSIIA